MKKNRAQRILVLLYGDITFDGRVKRMLEIAATGGSVMLLDASDQSICAPIAFASEHERVVLSRAWGTARRHISFWLRCLSVARRYKPDVVFAEDFFTTIPGYLSARIARARLVYDAHELIVSEEVGLAALRRRFWYYLERFAVQRCSLVIAASPERARIMREHYGLSVPLTYMRNIPFYSERTVPVSHELCCSCSFLIKSDSADKIIIYQGAMSLRRGIGRFVEAMNFLPPNYRLILVGDGPDLDSIRKMGSRIQEQSRFAAVGRVGNEQLAAITAVCDVGVVSYPYTGLNNVYCAPNKIYEYAQAGVPIVATNQPPLEALFKAYAIGETISESDSAEEVAKKIQSIAERNDWRNELDRFISENSPDLEFSRVAEAIAKVIN